MAAFEQAIEASEGVTSPQLQAFPINDFTGGLNYNEGGHSLAPNECSSIENFDYTVSGGLTVRGLVEQFGYGGFGGQTPHRICHFVRQDKTLERIYVITAAGALYYIPITDDAGVSYVDDPDHPTHARDLVYTGESGWKEARMLSVNNTLWLFSGESSGTFSAVTDTYTGVAWSTSPNSSATVSGHSPPEAGDAGVNKAMPKARFVEMHQGVMWAADIEESGSGTTRFRCRLWYSYPVRLYNTQDAIAEDEFHWGKEDYFEVDMNDAGTSITAIKSFGDRLVVFKNHATYIVAGWDRDTFTVITLSREVGCPQPEAVAEVDGKLWFFDTRRGLHSISGDAVTWEFEKLYPLLSTELIKKTNRRKVAVGGYDNKVFVSVSEGRGGAWQNNVTYVYFTDRQAWTKYDYGCRSFTRAAPKDGPTYFFGASDSKWQRVWKLDVPHDGNGSYDLRKVGHNVPVRTHWKSGWLDAGNPHSYKRWGTPEFKFRVRADGSLAPRVTITSNYDTKYVIAKKGIEVYGRYFKAPYTRVERGKERLGQGRQARFINKRFKLPPTDIVQYQTEKIVQGPRPPGKHRAIQIIVHGPEPKRIPFSRGGGVYMPSYGLSAILVRFYDLGVGYA